MTHVDRREQGRFRTAGFAVLLLAIGGYGIGAGEARSAAPIVLDGPGVAATTSTDAAAVATRTVVLRNGVMLVQIDSTLPRASTAAEPAYSTDVRSDGVRVLSIAGAVQPGSGPPALDAVASDGLPVVTRVGVGGVRVLEMPAPPSPPRPDDGPALRVVDIGRDASGRPMLPSEPEPLVLYRIAPAPAR